MTNPADPTADFTRTAVALVAANDRVPEQRVPHQPDVDGLRELLDLLDGFSSNDQRARYILTSNWFRDHGAAAGQRANAAGVWLSESA